MPCVGFEPTIPASGGAKTVHVLDRSATVTGYLYLYLLEIQENRMRLELNNLYQVFVNAGHSSGVNENHKNADIISSVGKCGVSGKYDHSRLSVALPILQPHRPGAYPNSPSRNAKLAAPSAKTQASRLHSLTWIKNIYIVPALLLFTIPDLAPGYTFSPGYF
jgi:hypothetical protein